MCEVHRNHQSSLDEDKVKCIWTLKNQHKSPADFSLILKVEREKEVRLLEFLFYIQHLKGGSNERNKGFQCR